MPGSFMNVKKEEKHDSTVQSENRSARQANCTGIPIQLKERLEQSTGMSLDDVRVHYNSALPARLDALAYTRGNQVEIGPGQENCLPHELGHVVQQKLGLVRANARHSSGVVMNTDPVLEQQADEIGAGKKIGYTAVAVGDGIVQRRLFIRQSNNVIKKANGQVMGQIKGAPIDKESIFVGNDNQYLEITEHTVQKLIEGFVEWVQQYDSEFTAEQIQESTEKIFNMISKSVESADPKEIYNNHINDKNSVPRLEAKTPMDVSYYFESLNEFYQYIHLSKENRIDPQYHNPEDPIPRYQRHWLKINMVNTGAGDAIVIDLPEGYLIMDLGTNLMILLNYLGLRKNKFKNNSENKNENIGIPLIGDKTCIVITHDHADHRGDYTGFKYDEKDTFLKNLIMGCNEFFNARQMNHIKHGMYDKIMRFVNSGDFIIYDFGGITSKDKNKESLVMTRQIGNSEAIILTGDQKADKIVWIIDAMKQKGEVWNVMFKVPHHGSRGNHNLTLFNKLSELGQKIDFFISSGTDYGHPNTGMYIDGNRLYSQGTLIEFNKIIRGRNAKSNAKIDKETGRVFYTADLNKQPGAVTLGSVVYKSDGERHVTYSKIYDKKTTIVNSSNPILENKALDFELAQFGIQTESFEKAQEPSLKDIDSMAEKIGKKLKDPTDKQIEEYREYIPHIYYMLNDKVLVKYLKILQCFGPVNMFLEGLDVTKLTFEECAVWEVFFGETDKALRWGQNYFYIMVHTCSEQALCKYFVEAMVNGCLYWMESTLDMFITCGGSPIQLLLLQIIGSKCTPDVEVNMKSIENSMLQEVLPELKEIDHKNKRPEDLALSPQIIFKLLYSKDPVDGEEIDAEVWLNEKIELLKYLDLGSQVQYFGFLLACGTLDFEEVEYVLERLAEGDDDYAIFLGLDISFFLQLLHKYPECEETIWNICITINSKKNKDTTQENEETEVIDWFRLNDHLMYEGGIVCTSGDDLGAWLKEIQMNFSVFINMLMRQVLFDDLEGNNICYRYALENIKEHVEYMADFLNIIYTYNREGAYLQEYFQVLWGDINSEDRIVTELLSPSILHSPVLHTCYAIMINDEAFIRKQLECPKTFISEQPMLLAYIMVDPPEYLPDIIIKWSQDIETIVSFYDELSYISPVRMSTVFSLYIARVKEMVGSQEESVYKEQIEHILNGLKDKQCLPLLEKKAEIINDLLLITGKDFSTLFDDTVILG